MVLDRIIQPVTALLDVTNRWYQSMDIGQLNGVVFLDLKKAFDTVDHDILRKLDISMAFEDPL